MSSKKVACFAGALLLLYLLLWYGLQFALRQTTEKALLFTPALGHELGLSFANPQVERTHLASLRSIAWRGVSARTKVLAANSLSRPGANYFVSAKFVGLTFLSFNRLLLQAEGVLIDPLEDTDTSFEVGQVPLPEVPVPGRIAISQIQTVIPLSSLFSLKTEVKHLIQEAQRFLTNGGTSLGLTVQGKVTLWLADKPRYAKLLSDTESGRWFFRLNRDDLYPLSLYFDDQMPEEEMQLIHRYPFRAYELIRIRDSVQQSTREAVDADSAYPGEALHMLYWSYLLTRTFGEEFATRVIDSYEEAKQHANPRRAMNDNNARVGREWAAGTLSEEEIRAAVRESPLVIRMLLDSPEP